MLSDELTGEPSHIDLERAVILDDVTGALERLRLGCGAMSYATLAARIADRRAGSGLSPAAARVPRSTVYDAFRAGRTRINPALIGEIVLALTDDADEARRWRERAVDVMAGVPPTPLRPSVSEARVTPDAGHALVVAATHAKQHRRPLVALLIVVAAFALNNLGGQFVADIGVPLFLDMTGTAVAALVLGPWYGVAAALANNMLGSLLEGDPITLWFALVNVAGALIWGYGVRAWGMGKTALRFLLLNVIVAVACSIVAVPILVLVFGGSTGHTGEDALGTLVAALGAGLWTAVFSVNLVLSFVDKLISGYLGLLGVWLFARYGDIRPAFGKDWVPGS